MTSGEKLAATEILRALSLVSAKRRNSEQKTFSKEKLIIYWELFEKIRKGSPVWHRRYFHFREISFRVPTRILTMLPFK